MLSTLARMALTLGLAFADNDLMNPPNPFSSPFPILRSLALAVICGVLAACGGSSGGEGSDFNSGGSGGVGASTIPFAPTPDTDPFYAQPDPLPTVPPGTILNSRSVTFAPALSVPMPNPAWQLQYMTRDVNDRPIAAITTVVQPMIPAFGTSPLVSYQFAYDSLGNECNPSKTLTGGTANSNNQAETLAYLAGLQTQGWTMVFPDYEGPYNAYGAGKLSGQATLDSIRAALSFEPLGLNANTPVGMWGYSGGALATSWAASLHPSYAAELNIVGVASGGTPADVFGVVQAAENGPFFGLILSAIVGTNRAYPELVPDSILNDAGRAAFESLKDACVGGDGGVAGIGGGPSGALADYTTVEDPYSTPGALSVRPKVTLPFAGHTPVVHMYVYHEILDELIPIAGTDAMVAAWCDDGAHVSYFRSVTGEHVAGVASGAPFAIAYLVGQFNNSPVPVVPPLAQTCN
jgi:hypothetical protein